MQGSPHIQPLQDDFIIDPDQEWQRRWWSIELDVTPDELRAAIHQVGPRCKVLREHFAQNAAPPRPRNGLG